MAVQRNYLNRPSPRRAQNGFRKWYERELLSSHAHMVLEFAGHRGTAGQLRSLRRRHGERSSWMWPLSWCVPPSACGTRRYLYLLMHAELVANQASCPNAPEYGPL